MQVKLSGAIAKVIVDEIERRGIDQQAYAAKAGLPNTTVWRKLKGQSKIAADDLPALADGLGWSMSKLLREAERVAAAMRDPAADPGLPQDVYRLAADVGEREKPYESQE